MDRTPPSVWVGDRRIPIYSLRDRRHHGILARALAHGLVAAFHAGSFGLLRSAELRSLTGRVHAPRPSRFPLEDNPLWLSPRGAVPLIASEQIHPAFQLPDDYHSLFASVSAPLQVVVPLRRFGSSARVAASDPADGGDAEAEDIGETPAARAAMLWMHDLSWMALADLLAMNTTRGHYYSFSPMSCFGRLPVCTLAELIRRAQMRGQAPFDLVAHDLALEATGALCPPTRIRLPSPQEEPALLVLRRGSVSAAWLAEATGWPVSVPPWSAPTARAGGLSDSDLRLRLDRPWQQW
ncbi:MAG TPA: hypothetical protein VNL71_06070 [Chloroflexota bacterium]|nr:hypothetical protein [Chloroflexota bacterium]